MRLAVAVLVVGLAVASEAPLSGQTTPQVTIEASGALAVEGSEFAYPTADEEVSITSPRGEDAVGIELVVRDKRTNGHPWTLAVSRRNNLVLAPGNHEIGPAATQLYANVARVTNDDGQIFIPCDIRIGTARIDEITLGADKFTYTRLKGRFFVRCDTDARQSAEFLVDYTFGTGGDDGDDDGGDGDGDNTPPPPPPPPDVTVSLPVLDAHPAMLPGESMTQVLTVSHLSTFNAPLNLRATNVPKGVTVSFAPDHLPPPGGGTSVMALSVGDDTFPMTHIVNIEAVQTLEDGTERVFATPFIFRVDCTVPFLLDRPEDQPRSQTVKAGERAVLNVNVSGGTAPLRYQWYMGARGSTAFPIRGVSGPQMTTPPIHNTTDFWVRVSNPCGSVMSWTATVTPQNGNGKLPNRRRRGID